MSTFYFPSLKAVQAAAMLVRQEHGARMNCMRLLKMLYLADREAIKRFGRPIVGGRVSAMERGPVLEDVYDLIRQRSSDFAVWDEAFERHSFEIELRPDGDPGNTELSAAEIELLQEVSRQHSDHDEWEMVKLTRELPEWRKNDPGGSSRPISLDDILEAVGLSAEAEEIKDQARKSAAVHRYFAKKRHESRGRLSHQR